MSNQVVHFEINGTDLDGLTKFYTEVFGWHVEPMPDMGYGLVDTHGGAGFNGGLSKSGDAGNGVTIYVEAADIQAKLDQAVALGAEVVVPVTEIPDVVTFANFRDPQGNVMGLVKGDDGPKVSTGDGEPVTWFEIMGKDAEATQNYYRQLFGWDISTESTPMPSYGTVGWQEQKYGGGIGSITGEAYVTCYTEVKDTEVTADKIRAAGGEIVMGPEDMPEVGIRAGACKDPFGNLWGFYKQIPMPATT